MTAEIAEAAAPEIESEGASFTDRVGQASAFGSGYGGQKQSQRQSASGPSKIGIVSGPKYHRWVMAEFMAAIVVVAIEPLLTHAKDEKGQPESPALFGAQSLVRMSAVSVIFFILALMANGEKSGKFAAAFGALILTALLVNTDPALWTKIGDMFGGQIGSGSGQPSTSKPEGEIQKILGGLPADIGNAIKNALKQLIPWG